MSELTLAEFQVIAKLIQSKEPTLTAARIVLVDGGSVKDAVLITGCLQPAVSRIVRRCRETHAFIKTAYATQATDQATAPTRVQAWMENTVKRTMAQKARRAKVAKKGGESG